MASPARALEVAAGRRVGRTLRRSLTAYLFLLPAFVFYALFRLIPYLQAFWYGLHDWDGLSEPRWVGLGNFAEALGDEYFWIAGRNTLAFMALDLALPLTVAFLLAIMVAEVKRGRTIFRVGLFTPYVLSGAVVAIMWKQIYNPEVGILNAALRAVGLGALTRSWLGETGLALPSLAVANAWHAYGFAFVVFLAALQTIDPTLYEAARIDGAGWWQLVRNVTIPGLSNAITMLCSLTMMGAISAFTFIYIMTGGGPNYATEVLSTYIYDKAFEGLRFGYASALSVALALIGLTVTVIFIQLRERRDA
jgi:raffinose/stachyose/melibiose transport system permease protein